MLYYSVVLYVVFCTYFCPAKGIAAASFCEAEAEQKIQRIARPKAVKDKFQN
jgi:hypothetical protein